MYSDKVDPSSLSLTGLYWSDTDDDIGKLRFIDPDIFEQWIGMVFYFDQCDEKFYSIEYLPSWICFKYTFFCIKLGVMQWPFENNTVIIKIKR